MLFEMRKNAKYLYDLPIARDVKTQNPIIVQEKSRRTQCTILGKAEAKKKKLLLSAIESDLDQKVYNDAAREKALRDLVKKGRADIKIPKNAGAEGEAVPFKDQYIVPRPGCDKEYQEIRDKYKSCCLVVVSPDEALCDEVARLALERGIHPKYIDSNLKYDSKRYTEFSQYVANLNPFVFTKKNMSPEDVAAYIYDISETITTTLDMIGSKPKRKADADKNAFFTVTDNTAIRIIISIAVIYDLQIKKCQPTWADVITAWDDMDVLHKMIVELEALLGEDSKLRKEEKVPTWEEIFHYAKEHILKDNGAWLKKYTYQIRNEVNMLLAEPHWSCLTAGKKWINLAESFQTGDVIVVNTGLKYGKGIASVTGYVFQQMVKRTMLDRKISYATYPLPVIEYIDQLPTILSADWMEPMLALSRKYGFVMTYTVDATKQIDGGIRELAIKSGLLRVGTVICLNRKAVEDLGTELAALSSFRSLEEMMPEGGLLLLLTKKMPPFTDLQLGSLLDTDGE